MKRGLFFLVLLAPCFIRAQLLMYENRPAFGPSLAASPVSGLGYITNGLVEWNRFYDAAGSGLAADASGNSNTIPLIGSPGLNGSYLALNGSTQYGDANSNQLISLDYGDLTICAWINKSSSSQKGIVDKSWNISGWGQGGWGLWIMSNNHLNWSLGNNQNISDNGPEAIPLNQWTFVVVTWSYSGHEADFYMDGLLTSKNQNGSVNQGGSSYADLEIGNLQNNLSGGTYAFDGGIHDVAIYNRVLSAAEIATNYLNTVSSTNTILPDLLYYEMTEYPNVNEPVYLADSSTRSNVTGTVLFNPDNRLQWDANPAAIAHSAIDFDGSTTFIETSNATAFNFTTNAYTVNLWILPRTAGTYVMQNGIFGSTGWCLKLGNYYQVIFGTETNGTESSIETQNNLAPQNSYTMITAVGNGPNAAIYVNGIPAASGSVAIPSPSTNTLEIGRDQAGDYFFNGDIWLTQIWGQALSPGAIAQLYLEQSAGYPWPGANANNVNTNSGTGGTATNCPTCVVNSGVSSNATYLTNGLVQWNKLNENPGTTIAADASGNGNTLPLFGSPFLNGSYLALNGTNQYGDAGNTQLNALDNGDISICAWLNKTATSKKGIVDKSYNVNNGSYGGWGFWVLETGRLDWWLEDNYQYIDDGGAIVTPGQWTFVTAVYHQNSHSTDFYFNGRYNSSAGTGAAAQKSSAGADLEVGNLGNNESAGTYAFDGSLQQIGIYNRALSGAEVQSNFQTSEATTNVGFPDLLYWKMTEYPNTNIPVYLADSSTHGGTTGTVHSAYSFQWITNQAAIPNTAGHFNGVSTYIDTSNATLFNFTTNLFTINLWLCPLTPGGCVMQSGLDNQSGFRMGVGEAYELNFGAEANAGESAVGTGPGAVNVGVYTMVTIVRSANNQLSIFINGIQAPTTGSFNNPGPSSSSLIFGTDRNGYSWLDGNIWEPQIWSRALTPVDVANLFYTQSAGAPWP